MKEVGTYRLNYAMSRIKPGDIIFFEPAFMKCFFPFRKNRRFAEFGIIFKINGRVFSVTNPLYTNIELVLLSDLPPFFWMPLNVVIGESLAENIFHKIGKQDDLLLRDYFLSLNYSGVLSQHYKTQDIVHDLINSGHSFYSILPNKL